MYASFVYFCISKMYHNISGHSLFVGPGHTEYTHLEVLALPDFNKSSCLPPPLPEPRHSYFMKVENSGVRICGGLNPDTKAPSSDCFLLSSTGWLQSPEIPSLKV